MVDIGWQDAAKAALYARMGAEAFPYLYRGANYAMDKLSAPDPTIEGNQFQRNLADRANILREQLQGEIERTGQDNPALRLQLENLVGEVDPRRLQYPITPDMIQTDPVSRGRAFRVGAGQGITGGFSDEIAAGTEAINEVGILNALRGQTEAERRAQEGEYPDGRMPHHAGRDSALSQDYADALREARQTQDVLKYHHPLTYGTGNVAGVAGSTAFMPGSALARSGQAGVRTAEIAKGIPQFVRGGMTGQAGSRLSLPAYTAAKGAGEAATVGGAYGGLAGAGYEEGGISDRLGAAGRGAAGGATVGAMVPPALQGGKRILEPGLKFGEKVFGGMTSIPESLVGAPLRGTGSRTQRLLLNQGKAKPSTMLSIPGALAALDTTTGGFGAGTYLGAKGAESSSRALANALRRSNVSGKKQQLPSWVRQLDDSIGLDDYSSATGTPTQTTAATLGTHYDNPWVTTPLAIAGGAAGGSRIARRYGGDFEEYFEGPTAAVGGGAGGGAAVSRSDFKRQITEDQSPTVNSPAGGTAAEREGMIDTLRGLGGASQRGESARNGEQATENAQQISRRDFEESLRENYPRNPNRE